MTDQREEEQPLRFRLPSRAHHLRHRWPLGHQRLAGRPQHQFPRPGSDPGEHIGFLLEPPVRCHMPAQVLLQIRERLELPAGHIQIHLVIREELATRPGQHPAPTGQLR